MNKNKLKNFFFENPDKRFRLRQIEREAGLAFPSVVRYTKELVREDIVKEDRIGNIRFYLTDRDSEKYLFQKKQYNIWKIYESGLINHLKITLHNPPIILFGSYEKGEDGKDSDIDIFIGKKTHINLKEFEKILGKKIEVFGYDSLRDIENKHLANNIINGTRLNEYIEVF